MLVTVLAAAIAVYEIAFDASETIDSRVIVFLTVLILGLTEEICRESIAFTTGGASSVITEGKAVCNSACFSFFIENIRVFALIAALFIET